MFRKLVMFALLIGLTWFTLAATGAPPQDGAEAAVEAPGEGAVVTAPAEDGDTVPVSKKLPGPKLPDWFPIAPPLLAIAVALLFRNVIPALFFGVWLGAAGVHGLDVAGVLLGLLDSFNVYVRGALISDSHEAIILFSLMIGGMVGILMKNGGMQGVVNLIARWANTPRRAQTGTAALGLGIFFDDYANSLVVGNTMRSVTDRLRVSREKLAYLVDSTAAPVSCIAFVTTWIGTEVGLIQQGLDDVGSDASGYEVFLQSIPFSFYPLLALFFVAAVAWTGRDFGPMLKAERRARSTGKTFRDGAVLDEAVAEHGIQPKEGKPCRAINAVLPILVMLVTVVLSLGITGSSLNLADFIDRSLPLGDQFKGFGEYLKAMGQESPRDVVGNADSYAALMWGSMLGMITAALMTMVQFLLRLHELVDAWYDGVKSMMVAMIVLVLAWALAAVTKDLDTAAYLQKNLTDSLRMEYLPVVVFGLAAAIAFATGSSWSTMGILMPLVVPLTWAVLQGENAGDPATHAIFLSSVACVLGGAVWGDHCSPISDTTVLSSMASGCDHIDHVRTQLPYAVLVGLVAAGAGIVPTAFGVPWYVCLPVGAAVLIGVLVLFGRKADDVARMDEEVDPTDMTTRTL